MTNISISLTQFIDFTLTASGAARANYVHKVKTSEYFPGMDYWKQLREGIREIHENNLPIDHLYKIIDTVNEKKRENYRRSINQYVSFARKKDIEWFDIGASHWSFNNQLTVRSQPELGLFIDGVPYLLKVYYKGKNTNINKNKVVSALTLMDTSSRNFSPPYGAINAILNLNNKKLYESNGANKRLLLSLEGDAAQFVYLWNNL
ncbi:hypothetical protein LIS82_22015 [Cytobacillus solani]|uniref:hypothetical protein n=1 Tax=Cytobacillus solani TaxID=1637975 RepID=UPI00207A569D|nr:hypothetical protein [Cytobacillus solani]USK54216.1 hypothetical protein LIS82_22015 [Cytobacillus solani]